MPEYRLPDEITLSWAEARKVLLSLYDSRDAIAGSTTDHSGIDGLFGDVEAAIRVIQRKLVPDFPE